MNYKINIYICKGFLIILFMNNTNKLLRVALYARVSTLDKGQDPETQLIQLREYAHKRNFEISGEFIDYASGTSEERK
jgi:predicted site-specific integrase-resolvase